jgi:AraC family transcriptional activator of pyochelin receptor
MDLHIADFVPSETIEQRFETQHPVLRFYFHVRASGYWELQSRYHSRSLEKLTHRDHLSSVLFYPEIEGKMVLPVKCRQFHLSIYITPGLLSTYLGGCPDRFPEDLRVISEGCVDTGFSHAGPLSHLMHQAIGQILDCPYSGPMRSLYLESKAMELVAHKLAQTASAPDEPDRAVKLDLQEADRIRHARDILCRDLENPPRLFDLAHAVGTNHCRLNLGFRRLFGTTVFGYLRQMRLAEARRLLEEESRNVTETALCVGYNSLSSFSKAFTGHFGRQPMACRKKKR